MPVAVRNTKVAAVSGGRGQPHPSGMPQFDARSGPGEWAPEASQQPARRARGSASARAAAAAATDDESNHASGQAGSGGTRQRSAVKTSTFRGVAATGDLTRPRLEGRRQRERYAEAAGSMSASYQG